MYRLATSSDILVTIVFSLSVIDGSRFKYLISNKRLRFALLLMFSFVILQSYTRYLWLMALIAIFSNITVKQTLLILIFFTSFLSLIISSEIEWALGIIDVISARFSDVGSLDAKYIQTMKLSSEFSNYPLLGKGSGSYVEGYFRSLEQKYQYENQWLALAMQFGIVGLSVFLALIFRVFINLYAVRAKLTIYIIFSLFIMSGLTNPNLTIVSSFIVYMIFVTYTKFRVPYVKV